jgi:hypothetical protein
MSIGNIIPKSMKLVAGRTGQEYKQRKEHIGEKFGCWVLSLGKRPVSGIGLPPKDLVPYMTTGDDRNLS